MTTVHFNTEIVVRCLGGETLKTTSNIPTDNQKDIYVNNINAFSVVRYNIITAIGLACCMIRVGGWHPVHVRSNNLAASVGIHRPPSWTRWFAALRLMCCTRCSSKSPYKVFKEATAVACIRAAVRSREAVEACVGETQDQFGITVNAAS